MTELEQYIQSYFGIQKDHLNPVANLFKMESIAKGDYFIKTGQQCAKLSFLTSGYLRIFTHAHSKEVTQWISTQGFFVTEISSFVFQTPSRWDIQALTDCTLYTIGIEQYLKLNQVVTNWQTLERMFLTKCFVSMEDRIMNLLSMSAEERFNYFFEHNKDMFNQVPLQYIASMLGMTPETLSRIRRKMIS